jgi:hypothetical protein
MWEHSSGKSYTFYKYWQYFLVYTHSHVVFVFLRLMRNLLYILLTLALGVVNTYCRYQVTVKNNCNPIFRYHHRSNRAGSHIFLTETKRKLFQAMLSPLYHRINKTLEKTIPKRYDIRVTKPQFARYHKCYRLHHPKTDHLPKRKQTLLIK